MSIDIAGARRDAARLEAIRMTKSMNCKLQVGALAAFLLTAAAGANTISNYLFTIPDLVPFGTPYTTGIYGPSAALDWGTFIVDPGSTATSELLASTDNLSGKVGNMMEFSTDAGFDGSAGNGIFTSSASVGAGEAGYADINVAPGTSGLIGFVISDGAFSTGSFSFGATSGWQRVTFTTTGPTDEFGWEIFSAGGGSMDVADPTAPTPEPGTLLLLVSGLGVLALAWRRRGAME